MAQSLKCTDQHHLTLALGAVTPCTRLEGDIVLVVKVEEVDFL